MTKKPPDWGCLSISVDRNYAGEPECVFATCLTSACVPSCPCPSSVSRSKRLAFELLWKWSMPYGRSRCGLTWFGFNTSPQEVHKASRSSFVMLVIFLRGPVEPFAVLSHTDRLLYSSDRAGVHTRLEVSATLRCGLILYPTTNWTTLCFFNRTNIWLPSCLVDMVLQWFTYSYAFFGQRQGCPILKPLQIISVSTSNCPVPCKSILLLPK